MRKISKYENFYLQSVGIKNQNKKKEFQELTNQVFESKVRKGSSLDLVDVLLEKEAYKDGRLNESFSHYLTDEQFKKELRFNSCAGLISEGISDLKSQSLKYLEKRGLSTKELELVDRNFDILYLGDERLLEGFLKWVGTALATALSPVIDYILKPGWEALKFVGTKMFGEEVMKKIEKMGQDLINKITGAFDNLDKKFQNVLDKTWSGIKSIAQRIGDFLKSFWELCKKVFNKIWEFIKSAAKGAMSVVTNNPKLKKLRTMLDTAEPSQNESADSGSLDSEISTFSGHIKMLFGMFNNGPAASENQKSSIDSSASQTFNPDGNTEVKVEEKNSVSFGKQVNFICDSLLWELKTNKNFTAEDLVNMNESKVYESSEGGASLASVRKEGPTGELAVDLYRELDGVGGIFSNKEKQANQIVETLNRSVKNAKEKNIDFKEVVKHVEELFKSLRKKRVAKWSLDKFGDYEDGENQLKVQKVLKETGFLYDPYIDMDDKQKIESKKFWEELGRGSGRTENLIKMMKNWTSDDYQKYDKQAKFKLKSGLIKKTKVGDPSLSVAIRSELEQVSSIGLESNLEIQKFLFEEKGRKNLPEDFSVDAKLKASDETKDFWRKFAKIWNGDKNSNELEGLLTSIEDPKVYDELDNICRQELGFSLKKKIKDEFSGMFTKGESKESVERIIKHFEQEKFGETNLKSEEAAEESGFIKKWCQSAVTFLISPFGKILEVVSENLGKLLACLPGAFFYSFQTLLSTFKALPLLLGVLVGIGIDSYCTYKGIKSLGGHNAGEAHAEPEGFLAIIGARITHGAEAIGVISKHESVSTEESTEMTRKPIIKKYDQFINESKDKTLNESSEGESKGFQWGTLAVLGTGLLMAYVANLFTVAFPPVGVALEMISVLLLTLHLLDLLREFSPKWFGEKSRMSVVTTPVHKIMSSIGMGH